MDSWLLLTDNVWISFIADVSGTVTLPPPFESDIVPWLIDRAWSSFVELSSGSWTVFPFDIKSTPLVNDSVWSSFVGLGSARLMLLPLLTDRVAPSEDKERVWRPLLIFSQMLTRSQVNTSFAAVILSRVSWPLVTMKSPLLHCWAPISYGQWSVCIWIFRKYSSAYNDIY